jgi:hypothetical protein
MVTATGTVAVSLGGWLTTGIVQLAVPWAPVAPVQVCCEEPVPSATWTLRPAMAAVLSFLSTPESVAGTPLATCLGPV